MTKVRAPLTFENALTKAAGVLGWAAVATLCGQKERTVRNWSDPDTGAGVTLAAALKIDTAYVAAGGQDGPPFGLCYNLHIELVESGHRAGAAAIVEAAARASKESGEAVAATLLASSPAATLADIAIAERELEESICAQTGALSAIRAAREQHGVTSADRGKQDVSEA